MTPEERVNALNMCESFGGEALVAARADVVAAILAAEQEATLRERRRCAEIAAIWNAERVSIGHGQDLAAEIRRGGA